jgi:hypothetical protein
MEAVRALPPHHWPRACLLTAMLLLWAWTTGFATAGVSKLWVARYAGPTGEGGGGGVVTVSPDGGTAYVGGVVVRSGTGLDYEIVAYDAVNGTKFWAARYTGPAHLDDQLNAIAVSPDGSRVFATGLVTASAGIYQMATIAIDTATGSTVWTRLWHDTTPDRDEGRSIGVSPDGTLVFVTGFGHGSQAFEYVTFAYDAATGQKQWVSRYTGEGMDSYSEALAVSADGSRVYVTGRSLGSTTGFDYATIAFKSTTGHKLWVSRFDTGSMSDDEAEAITISPDGGRVYVAGVTPSESPRGRTVAYDSGTGTRVWASTSVGSPFSASSLGIAPDGSRVYVTKIATLQGTLDYLTISYRASDGAVAWSRHWDNAGLEDDPTSLAVAPDGSRIYVTGLTEAASGQIDYATIAYNASTGTKLWVRTYDGPAGGFDAALSVAADPGGARVYVTGSSAGTSVGKFATIAYTSS